MQKIWIQWTLAVTITLAVAVYQRMTGPTYPLRGKVNFENVEIKYKLLRSHGGKTDQPVELTLPDTSVSAFLFYKRFKTTDEFTRLKMIRNAGTLVSALPNQPPAGKLQYKVILSFNEQEVSLAGDEPVIIRYKGGVPLGILIPHVIFMFLAMFISTRAGIEALDPKGSPRKYALWTTALLFAGGLIFGPLVQKFAFGEFWTGFPFGYDLTDNKTLIAFIGWIAAIVAGRGGKPARWWVLGASIVLMAIYLIPHSVMGSELDYSKMNEHVELIVPPK